MARCVRMLHVRGRAVAFCVIDFFFFLSPSPQIQDSWLKSLRRGACVNGVRYACIVHYALHIMRGD